jgi:hypothetical protein
VYDGVLVERREDDGKTLPESLMRSWEEEVRVKTGLAIRLEVKPFAPPEAWLNDRHCGGAAERPEADEDEWMDGRHLMSYEEVKRRWEVRTFKVVKSGNYVREDGGGRSVVSDRQLVDSYKHLHYANVKVGDSGRVTVGAACQFIASWVKDPTIRSYREMVFAPPPMSPPPQALNIWNGFSAERAGTAAGWTEPAEGGWASHPAVIKLVEFHQTLLGAEAAEYVLDWSAQMYQYPAKKTLTAILIKGEEGVGKNRLTDLRRELLGRDKFFQTATPSLTLYGRFNRQREGRLLIVINEANGGNNFAANDVIKDMITCDEFQSEGKGTNSYTMNCYARFIFTTNNDNCLRVNPDSRRYAVIEASSALRGNTEYFRELSRVIDDAESTHAFYRFLMQRDVSNVDWVSTRPASTFAAQMVSMNLTYEHQFFKQLVLRWSAGAAITDTSKRISLDAMYTAFNTWLVANRVRYETTHLRFGMRMSKLVWSEEKSTGFRHLSKTRCNAGVVYHIEVRGLEQELRAKGWISEDDSGEGDWGIEEEGR